MNLKKIKIVVVSTYPKQGSKNIGDQLITTSLISAIQDVNPNTTFEIVFRADEWDDVKNKILNADHVFFACLAIRKFMDTVEYPWLSRVVEASVPFSCIASGSDLPVNSNKNIYSEISESALSLLFDINNKSAVFTTRGVVTQFFLESLKLNRSKINGDIAFYNTKYANEKFTSNRVVKNIFISDPHNPKIYLNSMDVLITGLRNIFPNASITVLQHGINPTIQDYCEQNNIETFKVYQNPSNGLDIYDKADLHVGYRVHGHVSALSRRKYSYLLEQDGRGCDYGLTLERKISIPNYINLPNVTIPNEFLNKVFLKITNSQVASISSAYQMLALIKADEKLGFSKFLGLEKQIESFNKSSILSISKSLEQN